MFATIKPPISPPHSNSFLSYLVVNQQSQQKLNILARDIIIRQGYKSALFCGEEQMNKEGNYRFNFVQVNVITNQ